MTRKISSAEPQMAGYKPRLAKYRLPLEEDVIRKSGIMAARKTRILAKTSTSYPSWANRTLFVRDIVEEKKPILLSENDNEKENVLIIKKRKELDAGIELTATGPELYVRNENGVSKMELPRFFLIEVNPTEAMEILEREPPYAMVYAVLGNEPRLYIEKASHANLNRIINGEAEGRLFLGHYEWIHWEQHADRVRFEQ